MSATGRRRPRLLERIDPLAKVVAVLPAMGILVFARTLGLPLLISALAVVLLAVGARMSVRGWALLLVGAPAAIGVLGLLFGLWADPARAPGSTVWWHGGLLTLTDAGLSTGLATAARLIALMLLALLVGVTTTARGLVLAMIRHLRLPYRVGYAILVGTRFVPRAAADLRTIRQAHELRGVHRGSGPVRAARRWSARLLPLASGTLRRASRVALAMDARAFGAYPDRTERDLPRLRPRDGVLVLTIWAATAACVVAGP